jgi:hypothetical protein
MSKRVGPVYYATSSDEIQKPFSEETAKIIVSSTLFTKLIIRTRKSRSS